jgi:hypothetical protein
MTVLLGMMANDALSAFLASCDRVLYPSYASAPRFFPISPLTIRHLRAL